MTAEPETAGPNRGLVLPNWLAGDDVEQLVEWAVVAEESGWDGVFLADHLVFPPPAELHGERAAEDRAFPDPWVTLAGIATRTERVTLGSWVTPVPRRQPWQLARNLATLDRLSDGRVLLGTGLGRSSDYTTFGTEYEPRRLADRYDEALEIVDGLWRGERFDFDGEHFTLEDAAVLPTPVQEPRVPVVVGGVWPNRKPIQRGARWDGIVPHWPGDGVLPADDDWADRVADDVVRELVGYYRECTDDPGHVLLPADPPGRTDEYEVVCEAVGATWLYTRPTNEAGEWELDESTIREGPPN